MRLPNSGMSATMNVIIIKNWDWKSILTGIIRKKHIKGICGTDSCHHRQRRRDVYKRQTPACATVTSMAQLYDKDAAYASSLYVLTTLLSIVTMPVMVGSYEMMA